MAYYNVLWGSRYCRDCGGKASVKGPLCVCENDSPKKQCSPLALGDRRFCEHCGGVDPSKSICPHCETYPLDLSQRLNVMLLDRSLRLPLHIAVVAIPLLSVALIAVSVLLRFSDATLLHKPLLYGASIFFLLYTPLRYIGHLQKKQDIRKSQNAFQARHPQS